MKSNNKGVVNLVALLVLVIVGGIAWESKTLFAPDRKEKVIKKLDVEVNKEAELERQLKFSIATAANKESVLNAKILELTGMINDLLKIHKRTITSILELANDTTDLKAKAAYISVVNADKASVDKLAMEKEIKETLSLVASAYNSIEVSNKLADEVIAQNKEIKSVTNDLVDWSSGRVSLEDRIKALIIIVILLFIISSILFGSHLSVSSVAKDSVALSEYLKSKLVSAGKDAVDVEKEIAAWFASSNLKKDINSEVSKAHAEYNKVKEKLRL